MIDQVIGQRQCSLPVLPRLGHTPPDIQQPQGRQPAGRPGRCTHGAAPATCQRFVAWGFWMIFYFLRNEQGLKDNHKRVYWRVWKQAGLNLRVPPKRPGLRRECRKLLVPGQVNQGWAMDFVSDWVVGPQKKPVRIINIMDECSRRALWTEPHESFSAAKLIDILDKVVAWRGARSTSVETTVLSSLPKSSRSGPRGTRSNGGTSSQGSRHRTD